MGRTSAKVKNRYNRKAYDRVEARVPRGNLDVLAEHAARAGESVNGFVSGALLARMGLDAWPRSYKGAPPADEQPEGCGATSSSLARRRAKAIRHDIAL